MKRNRINDVGAPNLRTHVRSPARVCLTVQTIPGPVSVAGRVGPMRQVQGLNRTLSQTTATTGCGSNPTGLQSWLPAAQPVTKRMSTTGSASYAPAEATPDRPGSCLCTGPFDSGRGRWHPASEQGAGDGLAGNPISGPVPGSGTREQGTKCLCPGHECDASD